MASLLSVENLQVQFQTKKGINTAVDGVSFSVEKGRILGIVGESGCGKSVTSMSILQLLGSNARISGGSIKLDGKELIGLPEKGTGSDPGERNQYDFSGSNDCPESDSDYWNPADGTNYAPPELR